MAGMFIQMTLTNWVSPTDNITADDTNTYTFWIKTSTTLIIIVGMVHQRFASLENRLFDEIDD